MAAVLVGRREVDGGFVEAVERAGSGEFVGELVVRKEIGDGGGCGKRRPGIGGRRGGRSGAVVEVTADDGEAVGGVKWAGSRGFRVTGAEERSTCRG